MVALTPVGNQYRFTWWIGKQMYSGVGQFAGRMLVVNWGDKRPVIYSFGHDGELDGEWADGSATETLDACRGAPRPVPSLARRRLQRCWPQPERHSLSGGPSDRARGRPLPVRLAGRPVDLSAASARSTAMCSPSTGAARRR